MMKIGPSSHHISLVSCKKFRFVGFIFFCFAWCFDAYVLLFENTNFPFLKKKSFSQNVPY